jgi:hypothetical protein
MIKYLRIHIQTSKGIFARFAFVYYPLAADLQFRRLCPALIDPIRAGPGPAVETLVCALTFVALDCHFKLVARLEKWAAAFPADHTPAARGEHATAWAFAKAIRQA